jgi:hypothetical protein
MEYSSFEWENKIKDEKRRNFAKICNNISFLEYFESENDSIVCRKHEWLKTDMGYLSCDICPECLKNVEERGKEIFIMRYPEELHLFQDNMKFLKDKQKAGTLQVKVSNEEKIKYLERMTDLYPDLIYFLINL